MRKPATVSILWPFWPFYVSVVKGTFNFFYTEEWNVVAIASKGPKENSSI